MNGGMKNRLTLLLLAIFLCLPAVPARAAGLPETGTVVGEGAKLCQKLVKSSGNKENNFIVWVQGYFSAYNAVAPDITDVAAGRNYHWILDWLKTYCKAHPEEYFNDAVRELLKELHPQGIQINPEQEPSTGLQ
jgi:hypothetical protein